MSHATDGLDGRDEERDDAYWQRVLTPDQFRIMRQRHTEPAGSGEYVTCLPSAGHFACRACRQPLYSAASKFASGCGWPAFSRAYNNSLKCEPDLDNFHSAGARADRTPG